MRIKKTQSKNKEHYSIIKDIVKNGKRTTAIYENLGSIEDIKMKSGNEEPLVWLKNYVSELNTKAKEKTLPVLIKKYENRQLEHSEDNLFNVGHLFVQDLYYQMGIDKICQQISEKYSFKFDLNTILNNLIYSRMLSPASKRKTCNQCEKYLFSEIYQIQHSYRSLDIIAKEFDFIQANLYKNSLQCSKRNDKILYYDCSNFFFEIEQEEGLKQYGKSKENRPNPIVQMGLFLDGDGIPLAFDLTSGNTNEQITLKPLENRILEDFKHSKFIVCTDAGLASNSNRKFNNIGERSFVTTQPLKKLKKHLKEEAIDLTKDWKIWGSEKNYDVSSLRTNEDYIKKFHDVIFYKERWIKEDGLEQKLIVTYSVKYQEYQKNIRNRQIERAKKIIESNPKKLKKPKGNDPKRFIAQTPCTKEGEVAEQISFAINESLIIEEAKYDGLYAVCTNLNATVEEIINLNKRRWEIEESFRIMKTEFKSRPVYLSKDNRIKAHFTTCFIALFLYRYLEKKLDFKYTTTQIIETLQNMKMFKQDNEYYSPAYTRTNLTDDLHHKFGFNTDFEVISEKNLKKIFERSKK